MNKLTCRTAILLLASSSLAAAAVVPSEPAYVKSLNGTWRFKLESGGGASSADSGGDYNALNDPKPKQEAVLPAPAKEPFQKLDYTEGKGWVDLRVPGNWEMAGLSPATYNQPDNASGFYRLWFEAPRTWAGREVRLLFDGVQNGAEFWLNGQPVAVDEPSWGRANYHEGGWTAFQVDLTPAVKFGEKNLLAVRVLKKTRSVDLDTGDYFFLGGIHRPVTLFSVPKSHLADLTVQTRLLSGNRAEVKVRADVVGNDGASVAMRLAPPSSDSDAAEETTAKVENGRAVLAQIVDQPKLWSAEFPNLYNLTVDLKDNRRQTLQTVTKRIGIREVSVKNSVLLVNGKPVKLAGVCRHDVSPSEGTAVGPELWRKDIMLMKGANINAIRTSHYPYGAGFYDLCDELGIYVMDELPYCWCPTDDPKTRPAFEQRARETVRRDKNHPCVILWAIGNENAKGRNLQVVADLVKKMDPTRPRSVSCFNGDKYHVELSDSHYTTPANMAKAGAAARGTDRPHIYLENPNTGDIRLAADAGYYERWGAVIQRAWKSCLQYETIPGTFIFEWQDRAIADKCRVKPYTYYPETGIQLLKMKGLVDGFRNPRPSVYEVKMVYSPIHIGNTATASVADGQISFPVENRYSFTDLSYLKTSWALQRQGQTISSGETRISRPPLSSGQAVLSCPAAALEQADALQVEFVHPDGNSVVAHRFALKETAPVSRLNQALPADLAIPQFNLVTYTIRNDKKLWRVISRYTAHLTNVAIEPASAKSLTGMRHLTADVVSRGKVAGRLRASCAGGEFSYQLDWTGPAAKVLELGWAFSLPKSCDHFSWDRAGRWTVYPETSIARIAGTATPDTMNAHYSRMDRPDAFDFNSTKYDCNWASLTTRAGEGLRVEFEPRQRFHCRAGEAPMAPASESRAAEGAGYVLFVNQQVSPADDFITSVVPDLYLTFKAGSKLHGRFRVGSNQADAAGPLTRGSRSSAGQ